MTEALFRTACPEATEALGRLLGRILAPGDLVALQGDLGAGKTCLTRGIARGLEVDARTPVTSPTFTLMNEYAGRCPLYHLDAYRLNDSRDLEDLGYEDFFYGRGVTVIEWAERVVDALPETALRLTLTYVEETVREIRFQHADERRMSTILSTLAEGGFEALWVS